MLAQPVGTVRGSKSCVVRRCYHGAHLRGSAARTRAAAAQRQKKAIAAVRMRACVPRKAIPSVRRELKSITVYVAAMNRWCRPGAWTSEILKALSCSSST